MAGRLVFLEVGLVCGLFFFFFKKQSLRLQVLSNPWNTKW